MIELDLEDLGGEEIAEDFTKALVRVIEEKRSSVMSYDVGHGVYIQIIVQSLTEKEFDRARDK